MWLDSATVCGGLVQSGEETGTRKSKEETNPRMSTQSPRFYYFD